MGDLAQLERSEPRAGGPVVAIAWFVMSHRQVLIVPVDFSTPSLRALHWAFDHAKHNPSNVHIVHVVERAVRFSELMSTDIESLRAEMDDVKHAVADQLASVAPDDATRAQIGDVLTHVFVGRPAEEITNFAEQLHADLIVMGTHGHTGMKRILLGSVAERVVRDAPCTVVCVKAKRDGGNRAA